MFDFCAAFPSVAHELILTICKAMGLPEGLQNYLKFLYEDNQCIYKGGETDKVLYRIDSGIIQGCPLSGSIFVMTVDPFLRLLKKTLLRKQCFILICIALVLLSNAALPN